jgi:hypothetical protein
VEDAKEYARAVLASAPVACDHQFHFFVDQTERRCNRCGVIESRQAPLYRRKFCSGIDRAPMAATKVRSTTTASKTRANCPARGCRSSPGASRTTDGHVWDAPRPSWMEGGEGAVEMAREDGLLPASAAVDPAPAAGDGRHDA